MADLAHQNIGGAGPAETRRSLLIPTAAALGGTAVLPGQFTGDIAVDIG